MKTKIRAAIARRKQWVRLYPDWYIQRYFILNEGELDALLQLEH